MSKKKEHKDEVESIGKDSWELINYTQLPQSASKEAQIEALKADRDWQEGHQIEVSSRIGDLIQELELA